MGPDWKNAPTHIGDYGEGIFQPLASAFHRRARQRDSRQRRCGDGGISSGYRLELLPPGFRMAERRFATGFGPTTGLADPQAD
ncbi:MAG: hypothetical protein AAB676_18015 [Verrucomicrobiota bacterium]